MVRYFKAVKKFMAYLILANFTFIKANISNDLKLYNTSISYNVLENINSKASFPIGILEFAIIYKLNNAALNGTLSLYDTLISKLPSKTQEKYKNLTNKIDNSLNVIIEKTYGTDKKLKDRTSIDKIKIFTKRLGGHYLKSALHNFAIFSLRALIHSKLNKNSLKEISELVVKYPMNLKIPGISDKNYWAHKGFSVFCLLTNIKYEINYAFYNDSQEESIENLKTKTEENIKILEVLDPELAEGFKKESEEFMQNSIHKQNSPLRDIGTFIISILIRTILDESQFAASNYLNKLIVKA